MAIEHLTPKLRFPEFKDDWTKKYLSDFMTFKNGINASKEKYGSGYKFINVLDIIQNDFITHDKIIGSVSIDVSEFKKNIVEFGDILFQRSSETREEVGQANVYLDEEAPATFGGFVIRGKKKSDFDPRFMNYLLKTSKARNEITSKSGGSTRYNVGQGTLSKVTIHIPNTVKEQEKVGAFLSQTETSIELLNKKRDILREYRKSIMQKLFSQEIRFKDDHENDFPDWGREKLGDLLLYLQPTRFLVSSTEYDDKYDIPVLTAGKTFILGYTNEKTGIFRDKLPTIIFDDFTTAFKFVDFPFKAKSSAMKMLIPTNSYLNIKFIYEAMKTIQFPVSEHKRYWISEYQNQKIPYPTLAEQQKIVSFLSSLDKNIEYINSKIERTIVFKKGLLQKMFV